MSKIKERKCVTRGYQMGMLWMYVWKEQELHDDDGYRGSTTVDPQIEEVNTVVIRQISPRDSVAYTIISRKDAIGTYSLPMN